MKVFVANFADAAGLEAECEDPSARDMSLVDFASPQLSHVFVKFGKAEQRILKDAMLAEIEELYEGEDDDPKDNSSFRISGWRQPTHGRPNWTMSLIYRGEVECTAVVQELEVS